ncbi:YiiX/YebB-like N1pC/P60 family cysteine hydrolase [Marinifilum fragile]|uniref:YiiX/YebB-like N1pC/P60 family cysteine hydrolase n=1 Tax=Marinifilum fragile TaxID=570161 RepID=UPI002AA8908E|nr:YiiX/YebB-like N1pC/P60 family cysteine hydrolase [Marinifilum fragile]
MTFFRTIILVLTILHFSSCDNLQKKTQFEFRKGDLIFQDLNSDSISEAIESVTGGEKKLNFSHVGMVDIDSKGKIYVLEAISKGVSLTSLDSFLIRSNKVAIGRLNTKLDSRIDAAMTYGKSLLNFPYDNIYVMGDSSYYCSELIYEMFVNTGDSTEVFQLNPMTFKDNQSGEYLPFWVEYYKNLGVEIPEGKLGLNPNGMFQSKNIEIVLPNGNHQFN